MFGAIVVESLELQQRPLRGRRSEGNGIQPGKPTNVPAYPILSLDQCAIELLLSRTTNEMRVASGVWELT